MDFLTGWIAKVLSGLIGNAERLGALPVAAVWAFFTLVLLVYIVWNLRAQKQAQETTLQMRIKDAESDVMMAQAILQLRDEIKEFRHTIRCGGGGDAAQG